ncbi:MAG TPA: type II CAAX endopeptidase family protein [Candidatus Saccharimonadales bacterium]|nr:type II CAAX endopeptidase family protein [Candidatus Saccharimonadales bacterium]
MSANLFDKLKVAPKPWQKVIGLLLWVVIGFFVAQALLMLVVLLLQLFGVPLQYVNETMLQTVAAALIYVLTLVIVVGVPWWIRRSVTNKKELGLSRLPSWLDIGLAPAGLVIYLILTAIFTSVALIVPGFDANQMQETGFANLSHRYEYFLAFATLVVIAPLAEEILFRGYLYGKLRKYIPVWLAVLLTSLLFAAVHGQWNVAVDVFALSLVLCTLREITGNIWASFLLHVLKNGIAYYLLFINPSLLNIIRG